MDEPVILKIFLIGFHHKIGFNKDLQYPQETPLDLEQLENLPTLCLPDQSHNFESDSVYFVLPNKDVKEKRIFGVSCFRQIPIEKLTNRSENDEFSRSSVQKSVCCLSRLPLFGYIEVKLNIIVDKIFEQGNFDCADLLKDSYNELNRCLSLRIQHNPSSIDNTSDYINDFYIETCLRELIILWRHKILVLFKLLLLEKRVLFFGSPVKPVCATIISLISLHPQLLNKGLCNDFDPKDSLTFPDETETSERPVSVSSAVTTPDTEKSDDTDSLKQITILPTIPPAEYLAPLQVFKNGFLCLPFISLSYIDVITDKSHNGFVVGASNVLFQQKKNLVDVLIDVPNQTIDFIDLEMKKCLALTTEDLRFFEFVIRGIENPRADGYGTDSWIREQFESYFTSMLRTAYDTDNQKDIECFNEHYMEAWRKTNNYQDWLAKKITSTSGNPDGTAFDNFPKGHLFSKQTNVINVSDFKNKIVQSINNTQSARKLSQSVNSTLSNAKTQFSSWLSNFAQKDELPKDGMTMEARENLDSVE